MKDKMAEMMIALGAMYAITHPEKFSELLGWKKAQESDNSTYNIFLQTHLLSSKKPADAHLAAKADLEEINKIKKQHA